MKQLKRIVIYPKDIQLIMGKKPKAARLLLSKIKMAYNKPSEGFVSIDEFCAYTGIDKEQVVKLCID